MRIEAPRCSIRFTAGRLRAVLAATVAALLLAWPAAAWAADPLPTVSLAADPATLTLEADRPATLTLRVTVPKDHHGYLDAGEKGNFLPISLDFSAWEKAGITVEELGRPKGVQEEGVNATVFRGTGEFRYRLTVAAGAPLSKNRYPIRVRSQLCDDIIGSCYSPSTETIQVEVEIVSAPPGTFTPPAEEKPTVDETSEVTPAEGALLLGKITIQGDQAAEHSLIVWLLLAFVAGMILNVMPCVLPVVSIKVLSFVQQAGESRKRVLQLGISFALGMMLVFEVLAALAVFPKEQMQWGQQFQSAEFMIVMISVVFAFALSLLGLFAFQLPQSVAQLGAGPPREGLLDAFGKGIMATVLATPCSGPFLGTALAWALRQSGGTIFAVFTALGLGMALPYVVLTAFPRLLRFLPKPGPWMGRFKQIMGVVLLATAAYLMTVLKATWLAPTAFFLVFIAVGCWYWGRYALRMSTRAGRLSVLPTALLIIGIGIPLSYGLIPTLFPVAESDVEEASFDLARLQQLRREGRNVFIDFTADWCLNCKTNETFVYDSQEVRDLLRAKKVVFMQADITHEGGQSPLIRRVMKELGSVSVPLMTIFPADQPDSPHVRHSLVSKKKVLELLRSLPDTP